MIWGRGSVREGRLGAMFSDSQEALETHHPALAIAEGQRCATNISIRDIPRKERVLAHDRPYEATTVCGIVVQLIAR